VALETLKTLGILDTTDVIVMPITALVRSPRRRVAQSLVAAGHKEKRRAPDDVMITFRWRRVHFFVKNTRRERIRAIV